MQWAEHTLLSVLVKGGYALRGESMTRIEVLSDAVFVPTG